MTLILIIIGVTAWGIGLSIGIVIGHMWSMREASATLSGIHALQARSHNLLNQIFSLTFLRGHRASTQDMELECNNNRLSMPDENAVGAIQSLGVPGSSLWALRERDQKQITSTPEETRTFDSSGELQSCVADEANSAWEQMVSRDCRYADRARQHDSYHCLQHVAPFEPDGGLPEPTEFRRVKCCDLSTGGISFLWPQMPEFESVMMLIGTSDKPIVMAAEIAHSKAVYRFNELGYLVNCKFTKRLDTDMRLQHLIESLGDCGDDKKELSVCMA